MARSKSPQVPLIFTGSTLLPWFYLLGFFLIWLGVIMRATHEKKSSGSCAGSGGMLSLMVYESFKGRWKIETKISKRNEVIAYLGGEQQLCESIEVIVYWWKWETKLVEREWRQASSTELPGFTVLWMNNKSTKSIMRLLSFSAWYLMLECWLLIKVSD